MTKDRNLSIYIFISLLIFLGILIFIFKGKVLSYLNNHFLNSEVESSVMLNNVRNNDLDIKILNNQTFSKLKNHVLYFNFDKVGKPVLNQTTNPNLTVPTWQTVYLGNSNPFPVKKKDNN